MDLVNANYTDFLSLGASLKGGDERVEEVRVGLLGFRKEVTSLKEGVESREGVVERLVKEREDVRRKIAVGRQLIGFEEGLRNLEEALVIDTQPTTPDSDSEEEDEDDDDDDEEDTLGGVSITRLSRHVLQYRVVQEQEKQLKEHPFVVAQAPRMAKVRSTLLLDLSTALEQAKSASAVERVMKIMKVYVDMGESGEAVKVIKGLKA